MSIGMKEFLEEKKEFSRAEIVDAINNAIPKETVKEIVEKAPELLLLIHLIAAQAASDLFGEEESDDECSGVCS